MSNAEFEALIQDVEKIDGRPIIMSRYGWKIEVVNGKKYLMPMNESEAKDVGGSYNLVGGACMTDDYGNCHQWSCTGRCERIVKDGHWFCVCNG